MHTEAKEVDSGGSDKLSTEQVLMGLQEGEMVLGWGLKLNHEAGNTGLERGF